MAYSTFHNLIAEITSSEGENAIIMPHIFLNKFNTLVYGALKGKMLMSAWVGCYDSQSGVFNYSSAGHQPAIVMPAFIEGAEKQKKIKILAGGGSPVGFEKDFAYTNTELRIEPGDRVFAYTDGLLESHNPAKPDWKLKSLMKFLEEQRSLEVIALSQAIFKEAKAYHGEMMKADDVTYFLAEFRTTLQKLG
jgi:sigma-B regulation protein RsbU (phosphoserine phosphatase)